MPEICRFLGIITSMYYKELKLIEGTLPKRVVSLILEWANKRDGVPGIYSWYFYNGDS